MSQPSGAGRHPAISWNYKCAVRVNFSGCICVSRKLVLRRIGHGKTRWTSGKGNYFLWNTHFGLEFTGRLRSTWPDKPPGLISRGNRLYSIGISAAYESYTACQGTWRFHSVGSLRHRVLFAVDRGLSSDVSADPCSLGSGSAACVGVWSGRAQENRGETASLDSALSWRNNPAQHRQHPPVCDF
jgi:hypothetical protein